MPDLCSPRCVRKGEPNVEPEPTEERRIERALQVGGQDGQAPVALHPLEQVADLDVGEPAVGVFHLAPIAEHRVGLAEEQDRLALLRRVEHPAKVLLGLPDVLDRDLKDIPYRKNDVDRLAASEHLSHLVETNGFFTRLARACRRSGQARLAEWRGERRSRRGWGARVHPDGVGRISSPHGEAWFFFELDRGSEPHERLRAKLRRNAGIARLPDVPQLVLFAFPTERRESEARRSLFSPGLTVATAALPRAMAEPLGEVWQPIRHPFRVPLLALPLPEGKEGL
jgi:Replication-relaxation